MPPEAMGGMAGMGNMDHMMHHEQMPPMNADMMGMPPWGGMHLWSICHQTYDALHVYGDHAYGHMDCMMPPPYAWLAWMLT